MMPKLPSNIGKIGKAPPFFISFCNVSADPFTKMSLSSKAFTIFIISLTSSLENITAVPVPCNFV